ncbi:hypothetical protein K4K59_000468 [Colletotrichum sp. SAR11_240]|nr:hypothetical protein K4K59_000468 [Colletotrichum sp. SAR11_240]
MNDRLRPPSSGPAGRGRVHRQIAPAPHTAPLIPPTDIQPEYGGFGVNIECQEDQFIGGFQQPDAGAEFDGTNLDFDFKIDNTAINGTDINSLNQFIGQYGPQAHANAGSWNPLGAAATYGQNTSRGNYLASGCTAQQFMASQSTATPSQVESSLWDASSIYSGTTDSSMICEICLKLHWAHVKDCKRPPGRRPNNSRKVR